MPKSRGTIPLNIIKQARAHISGLHILYIKGGGVNPGLNPGFGVLRCGLMLWFPTSTGNEVAEKIHYYYNICTVKKCWLTTAVFALLHFFTISLFNLCNINLNILNLSNCRLFIVVNPSWLTVLAITAENCKTLLELFLKYLGSNLITNIKGYFEH
jgi:hypothetical protein